MTTMYCIYGKGWYICVSHPMMLGYKPPFRGIFPAWWDTSTREQGYPHITQNPKDLGRFSLEVPPTVQPLTDAEMKEAWKAVKTYQDRYIPPYTYQNNPGFAVEFKKDTRNVTHAYGKWDYVKRP